MDYEFRFDLYSKSHRKDSDKSRSRKDDDSLAEASHSKKTVKKAGNGEFPAVQWLGLGTFTAEGSPWSETKLPQAM